RSNTPIAAGARSDALLDGDVNQTTFPATGGTLAYTFTVESTADEPQPLDLWIEADGPDSLALHLASGTLAPGAAVTRTVEVGVGDRVPAGAYDVRFKLGDFASRRFITFERYAMVREGGAAVAASGEGTFEGVPLAGDLFAGAAGAPGLAGTHRLSAPSPNPSEARVAFTLEVAEAQQVAVGVHDALGRRVSVLHDGPMASGAVHRLVFDGSDLPAGVYVVRAVGERFADTRVVSLVR
ncbi:MAG: T9SS type A sorting domain-containing protein, partial [Rubricoccaceae bacterium]|nr:T9SS type A sorting domain-containing protein [Rubricoccaceae bacterium]